MKLRLAQQSNKLLAIVSLLLVGLVGCIWLAISHAGTSTGSVEPENGTVSGCASTAADTTASSGSIVKFQAGCNGFVHPGIVVSTAQLDGIKNNLNFTFSGTKPIASAKTSSNATAVLQAAAFNDMVASRFANLAYSFTAQTNLTCGSKGTTGGGEPTCNGEPSVAAYTDALIWYLSGSTNYADKANQILNQFSQTMQAVCNDTTPTSCHKKTDAATGFFNAGNTALQVGWFTQTMTPAAEIMRYTYTPSGSGHTALDNTAFTTMLTMFVPVIDSLWSGNPAANWLTSFMEATMDIGIYTGMANPNNTSQSLYELGVSQLNTWLPSFIYNSSDVNSTTTYPNLPATGYPIPSPNQIRIAGANGITPTEMNYWWSSNGSNHTPDVFISGQEREMCRDLGHDIMGLEGISRAAETERIQGNDLWSQQKNRLAAAYEMLSEYTANVADNPASSSAGTLTASGNAKTAGLSYSNINTTLCGGTLNYGGSAATSGLGRELAYNALHNRLGINMPWTKNFLQYYDRPATGTKAGLFMDWQELTYGQALN